MDSAKAVAPKVESQTDILHEASRRFGVAKRAIEEFNDKTRELLGGKGQYNSTKVRSVNIALIGDVKSGKSSSGNVLLGQPIFPQSFGPCTSRPTIVVGSKDGKRSCVLFHTDGH